MSILTKHLCNQLTTYKQIIYKHKLSSLRVITVPLKMLPFCEKTDILSSNI